MNAANAFHSSRADCPNCRGAGTLLALWPFIVPHLFTQEIGPDAQAPNQLEAQAETFSIASPRSESPTADYSRATSSRTPTPPIVPNFHHDRVWETHDSDTGSYAHMEHSDDDGINISPLLHVQTRLADGRPSLLIDPGSVGNLSGDVWAKGVAQTAARHGKTSSYERRPRPFRVSGVGQGTHACNSDCKLQVVFKHLDGTTVSMGHITVPTVEGS